MSVIYLTGLNNMNDNNSVKEHYFCESYDTKGRFISYWHQINEIVKLQHRNILEIGVGNKFVSRYLKERGYNVVTFDAAEELEPDHVGNILNIPFKDNSFDVVACFEVLEHIPYSDFSKALSEISRVSNSHVLLSLPDATRHFRFLIKIPNFSPAEILIPFPRIRKRTNRRVNNDGHYWEIGKKDYPLNRITKAILNSGFKLIMTYRVFEYPYHRFFILKKQ